MTLPSINTGGAACKSVSECAIPEECIKRGCCLEAERIAQDLAYMAARADIERRRIAGTVEAEAQAFRNAGYL
mgnify:CR=1 FL=1